MHARLSLRMDTLHRLSAIWQMSEKLNSMPVEVRSHVEHGLLLLGKRDGLTFSLLDFRLMLFRPSHQTIGPRSEQPITLSN